METKKCNICKIRAYIKCEQCPNPVYFCSRGHLYSHKIKNHRALSATKRQVHNNEMSNYIENIPMSSKSKMSYNSNHTGQQNSFPINTYNSNM